MEPEEGLLKNKVTVANQRGSEIITPLEETSEDNNIDLAEMKKSKSMKHIKLGESKKL